MAAGGRPFKAGSGEEDGEAGRWHKNKPLPETWPLKVLGVTVLGRLTSFRHLGLFPEQLPHWQWMLERLAEVRGETPRVLNLFAYTGAASLIAAQAGAEVTHVDASKRAIAWAKQNQAVSKLGEAPIRWILDDARKFVAREVRRGKSYHVILVDPPKFGRGPEGEVWDVFLHLAPLLRDCALLLAPGRASLVLTSYAIRASALATDGLVRECLAGVRARSRAESWPWWRRPPGGCCRPPTSRDGPRPMPPPDPRGGVRAITSLQNERVKLIRSLEMRKARRETDLFVAEGASVLVTAREAGWTPRMLVFLAGSTQAGIARGLLAWAEAAGAECLEVSPAVLAKLAAKDNPQTLLGVFEQRWTDEPAAGSVSVGRASGWRWRPSAIPAISAPSSAPPTRWARAAPS